MFAVIFEVHPKHQRWQQYLDLAKLLRPELIKIDGFIDNLRYRSLTRDGWLLSLSVWRDEKALVRWRTHAGHHLVQQQGRDQVLLDYHLRVGQITSDNRLPQGLEIEDQRLDETAMPNGTAITLVDCARTEGWIKLRTPQQVAAELGLDEKAEGLLSWDIFQGVLAPGELILLRCWGDATAASNGTAAVAGSLEMRARSVRVIRDYGKYQRFEAPQYYPAAQPNKIGARIA
jgi:heme-degrading monooxygenase HmoA